MTTKADADMERGEKGPRISYAKQKKIDQTQADGNNMEAGRTNDAGRRNSQAVGSYGSRFCRHCNARTMTSTTVAAPIRERADKMKTGRVVTDADRLIDRQPSIFVSEVVIYFPLLIEPFLSTSDIYCIRLSHQ